MSGRKLVMLLSNPFEPDVRVLKEARSLVNNGFTVTIVCWDREKKYPKFETINGFFIERCQLKGAYGRGLRSFLDFLLFHVYLILKLFNKRIDIVHCHDLDTLPAGFLLSKLKDCKIIYDAHEIEYFTNLPEFIRNVFRKMEEFFSKKVDGILITNEIQQKKFCSFITESDTITEIRNCPFRDFFTEVNTKDINKEATVVLGYIGYIQKGVGIEKAVKVFDILCEKFSNLELLLVGKVHPNFKRIFENLIANSKNKGKIRIIGLIPYEEVKKYYQQVDISFILYENLPQYKRNTPTKLFEAMAHGIPVIATRIGDVEEIIESCHCGFLVDAEDGDNILEKMKVLIDNPLLRYQMGKSGYIMAKENFCWDIMESRLLTAYERLNAN